MLLDGILLLGKDADAQLVDELADIAGRAFLEEPWTREMLDSMDWIADDKKFELAISKGIFLGEMFECAESEHPCIYYTPERNGVMVAYLASEMNDGIEWADIEEAGSERGLDGILDETQAAIWTAREEQMDEEGFIWDYPVNVHRQEKEDFIHIISFAVAPTARNSGVASKLMRPFLRAADEMGIPVYLECLSERLESLYTHYGFEVVEEKHIDSAEIYERIMVYRGGKVHEKAR